jgi:hypothetical protein
MKKLVVLFFICSISSCVDITKEECIEEYINLENWHNQEKKILGNNQEEINKLFQEYTKERSKIDKKCSKII